MLKLTDKVKEVLLLSFIKKCKTRNCYSFFSEIARDEGYENIAKIFDKFSGQEKEHAKVLFFFLKGQGEININQNFEIPKTNGSFCTLQNLRNSYGDEDYEYSTWYPNCAKISNEGGFDDLTAAFVNLANSGKYHSEVFKKLIEKMEKNVFFRSATRKMWRCEACGCTFIGAIAPSSCHFCDKSQDFFSLVEDL